MAAGERWAGTLGSRIFTVEQSLLGKRTVRHGMSHARPETLSNQSRRTVGKCHTSLPDYARGRVGLARDTLFRNGQETLFWLRNEVFFPKFSRRAPPVFGEEGQLPVFFLHQALYTVLPFWAPSVLV